MHTGRSAASLLIAGVIVTCGASAFVSGAEAAFDKAEFKCRRALAKTFLKVVVTGDKVVASCHKTRDKAPGLIGTDCNDLGSGPPHPSGGADSRRKFENAQQKLLDAEAKYCSFLSTTTIGSAARRSPRATTSSSRPF